MIDSMRQSTNWLGAGAKQYVHQLTRDSVVSLRLTLTSFNYASCRRSQAVGSCFISKVCHSASGLVKT